MTVSIVIMLNLCRGGSLVGATQILTKFLAVTLLGLSEWFHSFLVIIKRKTITVGCALSATVLC